MSTLQARLRPLAIAGVGGIAIAIVSFAAPASAADPTGAVTHSNLVSSQSGPVVTIDFDYAPVDPLAPGTITVELVHYAACAAPTVIDLIVPVAASGHYSNVVSMSSAAYTQVALLQTDGVSSVYAESNYLQDDAAPVLMQATIVPDVDPATGFISLQTGNDRFNTHYQLEIDGVPTTAFPSSTAGCGSQILPYSGLAVGSTLTVVETESLSLATLATFTNPLPAAPPAPPAPPASGATSNAGLASTGSESLPVTIAAIAALAFGLALLGVARRRRGHRPVA